MKVIAEITLIPIGIGVSLSRYVAECEKIFASTGIKYKLHSNGTNLEGEWEDVMGAIRECHEKIHKMGVPRIFSVVKLGTRIDREQTMDDKVRSVEEKLREK